jgi:uncharacterized protein
VADPEEGVGPDGTIVTGARRDRVPAAFEPLVQAAVEATDGTALFLYGSVATGQARIGRSDVDLLSVGPVDAGVGEELSRRFAGLCRGVEIAAAQPSDYVGDSDEAYGNQVFLRHYCVQLSGPPRTDLSARYPADARAARGFNGDIARHARRWRRDRNVPAHRVARKTLLAVAGLVSVHDRTWTTDRARAARRWGEVHPELAADLATLVTWIESDRSAPTAMLDGLVTAVVDAFSTEIGLWGQPAR